MYGIGEVGKGADCNQNLRQHAFKLQFNNNFFPIIPLEDSCGGRRCKEKMRDIIVTSPYEQQLARMAQKETSLRKSSMDCLMPVSMKSRLMGFIGYS